MWMAHKSVVSVGAALHDRRGASGGFIEETVPRETNPRNKRKNSSHQRGRRQERHRSSWGRAEVEAGSRLEFLE